MNSAISSFRGAVGRSAGRVLMIVLAVGLISGPATARAEDIVLRWNDIAARADLAESHAQGRLSLQFANWILGCALIYGSLFGIGKLIFKEWLTGLLYLLIAIVAGVLISRNLSRGESTAESLQLEHAEEAV